VKRLAKVDATATVNLEQYTATSNDLQSALSSLAGGSESRSLTAAVARLAQLAAPLVSAIESWGEPGDHSLRAPLP